MFQETDALRHRISKLTSSLNLSRLLEAVQAFAFLFFWKTSQTRNPRVGWNWHLTCLVLFSHPKTTAFLPRLFGGINFRPGWHLSQSQTGRIERKSTCGTHGLAVICVDTEIRRDVCVHFLSEMWSPILILRIGVEQQVQDPRYSSKDTDANISQLPISALLKVGPSGAFLNQSHPDWSSSRPFQSMYCCSFLVDKPKGRRH